MPKHTEKKWSKALYIYTHPVFAKMLNPSELYHYKHISESIEPEGLTPVVNTKWHFPQIYAFKNKILVSLNFLQTAVYYTIYIPD